MMARLLAGVILLLIWLLGTQSGLRALVALAVDWAPVGLSVEQVEGRVLGRMGLDGLVIDHPSLRIELGRLVLDWSPTRLLSGRLHIHELGLDRLDLTLPEQPERDDRGLPELSLPVAIELERALIRSLRVLRDPAGPPTWQAEQILLGGRLVADRLELEQIGMVLAEPRIELAGSGSLGLVEPHGLDLVLDAVLGRAPHRDLVGHARVQADLARLEARVRVSGLAEADLQLQVARPLDQPRWDARLMLGALDLGVIADRLPAIALSGLVTSRGEWGAADLGARLVLDSPSVEPIETGLDLFWEGDRLRVRALDVTQASSGTRLSTSGQVEVRSDRGSLTADVPSPDDWARARARLDRLSLERPELGGVWDLERPARLDWDWPELSAEPFCLRHAGGSRACLRLSHLTSADWEAGVDLDPLVLGLLAPYLPDALALEGRARINGRVMTTGGVLGAEATARIDTGTLLIAAVSEKVLSLAGAQLEIAALPEGRVGRDRARAQLALPLGDLGRLDAELELPGWRLSDGLRQEQALAGRIRADLQRLDWVTDQIARPLTRVRGRAEAGVRLAGTLADPQLSGEAVLQAERMSLQRPVSS